MLIIIMLCIEIYCAKINVPVSMMAKQISECTWLAIWPAVQKNIIVHQNHKNIIVLVHP